MVKNGDVDCGLVFELFESASLSLVVDVLLKVTHLVGNEAEDVMEGEPFDVGLVFVEVLADGVEFGEEGFGFHVCTPFKIGWRLL
jgi:hypothetical protein